MSTTSFRIHPAQAAATPTAKNARNSGSLHVWPWKGEAEGRASASNTWSVWDPDKELGRPPKGDQPFVIVNPEGKLDPGTRRLVRSHVMRGRNTRKDKDRPVRREDECVCRSRTVSQPHSLVHARVGPAISEMVFAEKLDPHMKQLVRDHITVLEAGQFPGAICRISDSRHKGLCRLWLEFLSFNKSFLHTVLFAAQVYFDWRRAGAPPEDIANAQMHLNKSLHLLQARLAKARMATSNSTIATIALLCVVASTMGDGHIAKQHMNGLKTIVKLRGGLGNLDEEGHLRRKIFRIDLGAAMAANTKPTFCADISYDRFLTGTSDYTTDLGLKTLFSYVDRRLVNIWADLREFSHAANQALENRQKFAPAVFQDIIMSVMYRLLHLECNSETPEEALRLGMLVYISTIYLQFEGARVRFDAMANSLGLELAKMASRKTSNPLAKIVVWLDFIDAISYVCDSRLSTHARSLRLGIENAEAESWEEVREILKGLLWIDKLHDELGKHVYDAVMVK